MPFKTITAAYLLLFSMFSFTIITQHPVQINFDDTVFKNSADDSFPDVNGKQNIIEKINNDKLLQKNIDASLNTAILIRGPYMNLATQTGIIIRWRTDIPTDNRVNYGTAAGDLTDSVIDSELTTEHIVQLTGLTENTQYFYSIGSSAQTLQGDSANYFKTLPPVGSKQKIRILVMGDMGTNSSNQKKVLEAYLAYNAYSFTNMWLMLGDNAYNAGLDSEFQNNFFNIYQTNLTKNHVMWPAPGNHDYANRRVREADHLIAYYDIFSLPAHGEAGGVPSNTEAYYSFNYGNVHFISLDSYGWETGSTRIYDTTGPQATWLKQDLTANTQPWTVVYFHHPPYSKGADSDLDSQLIKIRMRVVPILERYKVDLVLCGHSHLYERSFLINGHYGLENTFDTTTMALSASSAAYDGTPNSCPYIKNSDASRNGIVYAVVGSAGYIGATAPGYPHNAMEISNAVNGGAMVIEIEDNRLDAKWIGGGPTVRDQFTLMKDVNKVIDTSVSPGSGITLTASWMGNYVWSNGGTTRSITITPGSNTSLTVHDSLNCLKDSFHISVSQQSTLRASATAGIIACNGEPTTVTVTASGGTPPYTGTGTFTATAGTHDYIVTDADGNSSKASINITEPDAVNVSVSAGTIACFGGSTTVSCNASGGTGSYLFRLNNGSYQTSNIFSNVTAGTNNIVVQDLNGCTSSASFVVTQPGAALKITVVKKTDVTCKGGSDGSIQVKATGGTSPYLYKLNNGTFTSNSTFNNLKANTYSIRVRDANHCVTVKSITVKDGQINCLSQTAPYVVNSLIESKSQSNEDALKIKIFPNPTDKDFLLQIETNNKEPIEVVINDIYGRKVFYKKGSATKNYSFGSDFISGMYILKVIQGKNIQTIKLIKGK